MEKASQLYFATVTQLVYDALDKIEVERLDRNPERALWEVHGMRGPYHIRLKEIHTQTERLYSYYILKENEVVAGWDNYPDRQVLRQKYGKDVHKHLFESIPHKHGFHKATIELTEEMSVALFLQYVLTL